MMDYDKLLEEMQQRRGEGLGKTSVAGFVLTDIDQLIQAVRELREELSVREKAIDGLSACYQDRVTELTELRAKSPWLEPIGGNEKIAQLEQQVRELRADNDFLSESINAVIKDREYYEKRHAEINIELGIRENQVQRLIGESNRLAQLEQQNAELREKNEKFREALPAQKERYEELVFELEKEREELRAKLISFDDVEGFPRHYQGEPTHELIDLLTAADCNAMVSKIKELQAKLERAKEAVGQLKRDAVDDGDYVSDHMNMVKIRKDLWQQALAAIEDKEMKTGRS